MEFPTSTSVLSCLLFVICINAKQNCDQLGSHFYTELNCTPRYASGKDCPTSYSCPEYATGPDFCPFRGVNYNVGDLIKNTSYCNFGCYCDGGSAVSCPEVDCYFGPEQNTDCYKTYKLRQCCSDEENCPPFDNLAECKLNGKIYKEGQIMDTSGTCWICICQKGFKGVFEEPHCIRNPCDMELRYSKQIANKCAPIYRERSGALCCPSSFLCPNKAENINIIKHQGQTEGGENCKFGDLKMNINDRFTASYKDYKDTNVTCTCNLPPYVSCVYN